MEAKSIGLFNIIGATEKCTQCTVREKAVLPPGPAATGIMSHSLCQGIISASDVGIALQGPCCCLKAAGGHIPGQVNRRLQQQQQQ
jgi:hypothetical protein